MESEDQLRFTLTAEDAVQEMPPYVTVRHHRLETDEEMRERIARYETRLEAERREAETKEAAERKLLAELKAKYEPEGS